MARFVPVPMPTIFPKRIGTDMVDMDKSDRFTVAERRELKRTILDYEEWIETDEGRRLHTLLTDNAPYNVTLTSENTKAAKHFLADNEARKIKFCDYFTEMNLAFRAWRKKKLNNETDAKIEETLNLVKQLYLQQAAPPPEPIPAWAAELINKGYLEANGKTCLQPLHEIVDELTKTLEVKVTSKMLSLLVNKATGRPFSKTFIGSCLY
jgi:hypothetical protein